MTALVRGVMAASIASGDNVLTTENIDDYNRDVRARIDAFDMDGLIENLEKLMQARNSTYDE